MEQTDLSQKLTAFRDQMNSRFAGKKEVVENLLCCFLAGGHILLEDVPGVGKTTLARTFANSLGLSFGRIQFTPDTMPGDVTGMTIYDMKSGEFHYRPGAILQNIVLADELNRTPPKTQSALLEAMAEGQVSVDGDIHAIPQPFMVVATQNPISFTGTYPLPEAQLDRFMMKLTIGYPDAAEEIRMAKTHLSGADTEPVKPILTTEDVLRLRKETAGVTMNDAVLNYAQQIIAASRSGQEFLLGASPRALIHLTLAARAYAYLCGRDFVTPNDLKHCTVPVLSHRLLLSAEMKLQKKEAAELLWAMLCKIKVPVD
ncbi:MAG: MoxR family ATPase [Lachnospiraceae bacterium]|nr:MoxR family ATPase [Lachnospiraceae bacterium]